MLEKIGIIPDCHVPFHNVKAVRLVQKVFKAIGVSRLVILGDFADCPSISTHSKDPMRVLRFEDEIKAVRKELELFVAATPKAKGRRYFISGNHEYRLIRYLNDTAPELAGIEGLSVQKLFGLDDLGFKFTPYKDTLKLGRVYYTHDTGKSGANAIRSARADFEGNVVIGHTHYMGTHYSGNARGKSRGGFSFGWLGSHEAASYLHKLHVNRNWQLGFGIGYMQPNGTTHMQAIPIIDGKCVVEGKLYV